MSATGYVYQSALVHERGLYVMTTWHPLAGWPAQTRIWDLNAPGPPAAPESPPVWQRTYTGAVSAGGLAEAHASVVDQVQCGQIPAPTAGEERAHDG